MEEETLQERQQNELEALKAIFADQFVNCNEGSSTWKPLDVILTVVPQRENSGPLEVHVQLDLHVIACEEYPNKVPKIMLEKSKGLSDKQITEISIKLQDLSNSLVGEVMIFELVSYIQTVLTACNKPSFQSFYEEMLSRQKEKEKKKVELQKTEEDMKRQLIELEVEGIKKERQKKVKTRKSGEIGVFCDDEIDCALKRITLDSPAANIVVVKNNEHKYNETCHGSDESFSSSISHFNPNSRLVREFEILNFIGSGAFGDVLKVRNKLDDCLYAIKRIQLNLKNKQMNKKITREVKLLSRLNHENVVRYYNSWLENTESQQEDVLVHQVDGFEKKANFPLEKDRMKLLTDNLNLSFPHPGSDPSFSDDDDEDDDDNDWIEFMEQNADVNDSISNDSSNRVLNDSDPANIDQYMYIQMEYCEKSTLRNAIDDNLYQDENRVWRLLKEVVEGLAYIHEQGIIHRDLKPVNIFIDCNDHVKIGDFGLATPNKSIATKTDTNGTLVSGNDDSVLHGDTNASHTGQVGTALYVAPELNSSASHVHYNQKVDIYSLGIIFFEMCYPPLQTQMERFKILSNLRKNSRDFPTDFLVPKWCRQIKLIRELLNHNFTERPSAIEILEKEYIPLTELEDEKIHETIRHTLCNPQSKMYKHLIAECFNQKVSAAEDITFNTSSHTKTAWQHAFVEKMADHARKIFRLHGGTCFSTPLFTPNNGVGITDTTAVPLMTRFGTVVNAPYDLRLSFARYLAQNPHITHMKRYTVDRVFRERRMLGVHPKENFECTFDIVSPNSSNLAMEAEVLLIACEFLESFSECLQKNYIIRLNHVSLVAAILYYHQVVSKKHPTVCNFLSKLKASTSLNEISQDISDINIMNVINALNVEIQISKFPSYFSHMLKKNTASSSACRIALIQLENLIQLLISLKIKCPIVIAPNVITNYNHYSGIMFQVVWERKNKNNTERDVIAAGGRYDNLIMQYKNALNVTKETKQSAVGLTVYLDRLANALQPEYQHFPTVEVLVCSVGSNHLTEEKLKLVKELWMAEIRSTILNIEQSLEETQEYCSRMKIPHMLYLKEAEPGILRLRSWTREKLQEKKLTPSEVVPYLKRVIKGSWSNAESTTNAMHHHSRSESRSASVGINETHNINITFLTEEKLSASNKRRYENQASNCISNYLHKISTKTKIELIILNTSYEVLTTIVSIIDFNSKNADCLASLIKKYPRYKKCLNRVIEYIEKLQTLEHVPVVIFYSIDDNNCKILI